MRVKVCWPGAKVALLLGPLQIPARVAGLRRSNQEPWGKEGGSEDGDGREGGERKDGRRGKGGEERGRDERGRRGREKWMWKMKRMYM